VTRYRPEIDGLRALAVVPVILFHAGVPFFSGGYIGVDVFFVISGYLITQIILVEHKRDSFTLSGFYERRVRRLLPCLFLVMLCSCITSWYWFLPYEMKDFSQSLLATISFTSNFLFAYRSGYFDVANEFKPLLHTWSLAVEEQYYLFFPILLIAVVRFIKRPIAMLLGLGLISLITMQWLAHNKPIWSFYMLPTRFWELLIGALGAYLSNINLQPKIRGTAGQSFLSATGLLMIILSAIWFDKSTPWPSYLALIPTVGTLLILSFASTDTLTGRLLSQKWLVSIGLISYSLYLWHQPVFAFLRYRTVEPVSPISIATAVVLITTLSYLSWSFVELPCRDKQSLSRSSLFLGLGLFGLIFIGIGLGGHFTNGYPDRSAPRYLPESYFQEAQRQPRNTKGIDGNRCVSETGVICRIAANEKQKNILLIGDSHSADYTLAFREYVVTNRLTASQMSIGSCAFLTSQSSVNAGNCGQAKLNLRALIQTERFDSIIIVGDYNADLEMVSGPALEQDIDDLQLLLAEMLSSGSTVLFFYPRDHLSVDPMRAAISDQLALIKAERLKPNASFEAMLERMQRHPKFKVFNERDVLINLGCGQADCFDGHTVRRLPLYSDTNHLTDVGANLVFNSFKPLLSTKNFGN
jgi:peptidoglycan/LPS O-acetylase OafA/YrhL